MPPAHLGMGVGVRSASVWWGPFGARSRAGRHRWDVSPHLSWGLHIFLTDWLKNKAY